MVGVLEEEKEGQCGWIIKNGGEKMPVDSHSINNLEKKNHPVFYLKVIKMLLFVPAVYYLYSSM